MRELMRPRGLIVCEMRELMRGLMRELRCEAARAEIRGPRCES